MTTFPDQQNEAAGAIPVWEAGPPQGAVNTQPNISVPTVLKASPGTILAISVITAGSSPGTVNDAATTSASAANQIGSIPNTVGAPIIFNWPCQNGILIVPGSGQVVAVKWV